MITPREVWWFWKQLVVCLIEGVIMFLPLLIFLAFLFLLSSCTPQPTIVGLRTVCVQDSCWTIATYSDGSILRWPVEDKP